MDTRTERLLRRIALDPDSPHSAEADRILSGDPIAMKPAASPDGYTLIWLPGIANEPLSVTPATMRLIGLPIPDRKVLIPTTKERGEATLPIQLTLEYHKYEDEMDTPVVTIWRAKYGLTQWEKVRKFQACEELAAFLKLYDGRWTVLVDRNALFQKLHGDAPPKVPQTRIKPPYAHFPWWDDRGHAGPSENRSNAEKGSQ